MAIKNTALGGTDWIDGIVLYAADLNDTFDAITTPLDTGLNITRDSATGSAAVVSITQDNASDTENALSVQNDGTGIGLSIDQNGDAHGIQIVSAATTGTKYALDVQMGASATGTCAQFKQVSGNDIKIGQVASDVDGSSHFLRNLALADTGGPVVFIEQDNAGDDQNALSVQNDGTGNGLYIDQNGNGLAFNIAQATNGGGIYIGNFGTGDGIELNNDGAGVGVNIDQSAAGGIGLFIKNAGTGNGILIDQNGAGIALNIDKEGAGVGVNIDQSSAGGDALVITNAGTGEGLQINQTGAASALNINQDGNDYGINLNQSSSADSINITNSVGGGIWIAVAESALYAQGGGNNAPVITVSNDGSGNTIYDNSSGASLSNAGTWTNAASYRRYKNKVEKLKDAVDIIKNLDVDVWQYKNEKLDGKNRFLGDKNKHCSPYLDDWYNSTKLGEEDGVLPMDYIGVIMNAIKELDKRLSQLEND